MLNIKHIQPTRTVTHFIDLILQGAKTSQTAQLDIWLDHLPV